MLIKAIYYIHLATVYLFRSLCSRNIFVTFLKSSLTTSVSSIGYNPQSSTFLLETLGVIRLGPRSVHSLMSISISLQ